MYLCRLKTCLAADIDLLINDGSYNCKIPSSISNTMTVYSRQSKKDVTRIKNELRILDAAEKLS